MSRPQDLDEIAEHTGLNREQVAAVVVALIEEGWLFSSHFDPNPYDVLN